MLKPGLVTPAPERQPRFANEEPLEGAATGPGLPNERGERLIAGRILAKMQYEEGVR